MPVDHRHYHEGTYKDMAKVYTFRPKTNKSHVFENLDAIEEEKRRRANFELNRSTLNQSYSMTHAQKVEMIKQRNKILDEQRAEKNPAIQKSEKEYEEECTFMPKTNMKKSVKSRYF